MTACFAGVCSAKFDVRIGSSRNTENSRLLTKKTWIKIAECCCIWQHEEIGSVSPVSGNLAAPENSNIPIHRITSAVILKGGFFMRLFVMILAVCICGSSTEAQTKRAFIVGMGDYEELPDLSLAVPDAIGYGELFGNQLGYQITSMINPKGREFAFVLRQFVASIEPGDDIVFVYSGHAFANGNENYLVFTDTQSDWNDRNLDRGLVVPLASDLLVQLKDRNPVSVLAIIDASRGHPFLSPTAPKGRGGLVPINTPEGISVVVSAGYQQTAIDQLDVSSLSKNSLFAGAMLQMLSDNSRPLRDIIRDVRNDVRDRAAKAFQTQVPAFYDELPDGYCLGGGCQALSLNDPKDTDKVVPGSVLRDCAACPELVVLPAGSFIMGGGGTKDRGHRQRHVRINYQLAVGKYEVTWDEWETCVQGGGCNGSGPNSPLDDADWGYFGNRGSDEGWGKGRRPVINVSWQDGQDYVAWLSKTTGETYRLLSESEWEYAARSGSSTSYSWGDDGPICVKGGRNSANHDSCVKQTLEVGFSAENAFGLHDMHGNAQEWVEDCYVPYYNRQPSDGGALTEGECGRRVNRGGSWFHADYLAASARRSGKKPETRNFLLGLRVARTLREN